MHKKAVSNSSAPLFQYDARTGDLPASQTNLHLVRDELKADGRGLRSDVKAGFDQMNARFSQVDARFNHFDSKFSLIDSRFNQMDSKFERMIAEIARIGTLFEEQNSRNRIVMEGLTGLWQRQERVEAQVKENENLVRSLGRGK